MPEYFPKLQLLTLRLRESFNLSKASASEKVTLIAHCGNGVGEGSPSVHYGMSAGEVKAEIEQRLQMYDRDGGRQALRSLIDALPSRLHAGRCALEMADLDRLGKERAMPLYQLLGIPKPERVTSSFTITPGSDQSMRSQLERAEPFDTLKLKVGFARDVDFVDYVLKNKECRLRLDANGGWTVNETIQRVRAMQGYPIDFLEQPTTDPNLSDLDTIKTSVDCRVFLDESIIAEEDVVYFAPVIDGVNIKLTKCGGIGNALEMVAAARSRNLSLLLGCMIETAIGITASLHLASQFDMFDLDALLLTENDPFWGAQFDGQSIILPEGNGIAITTEENTFV
jgi:L-Ala-D/L-Glu epimerase